MANKYLFLFTIGPVQSFIAEARKTKDLYAGSKLLSDLIGAAIEETKERDKNTEIIFPAVKIKSKPNRFIAIVETEDTEGFGKGIEETIRKAFKEIADNLFVKNFDSKDKKPLNFDDQIEDFLEVFWVMKPYENNYTEIYNRIEQELGAIKNVRIFKQLTEKGRKCSLCGKRNVLFYKKTSKGNIPAFIQDDALGIKQDYLIPGEGLCAICFVKRFYKDYSFPSTAKIASLDWVNKIGTSKINEYKKSFANFDEQIFYEENLRKEYLEKHNHLKESTNIEEAKSVIRKLYKDFGRPTSYYALLMLDGDNMGKWLAGEFLQNKEDLKDFHKEISIALGEYARKVKEEIVDEHKGRVIYAGGDDVMAFVNLNYLFEVLKKLREEFPQFENLGFKLKSGVKSSASAGIVVAHYKTPLSEVLSWARNMEHEAKNEGKRDAFAIAVLKHAGEIYKTVYKWQDEDQWFTDTMKGLIDELNDDENGFSNNFLKTSQDEFKKIDKIPHGEMLFSELRRLLMRSTKIKDKEIKKKKVEEWLKKLELLFFNTKSKENFFSFLNIADFLSREVKSDN